jgi:hypothetical protein
LSGTEDRYRRSQLSAGKCRLLKQLLKVSLPHLIETFH